MLLLELYNSILLKYGIYEDITAGLIVVVVFVKVLGPLVKDIDNKLGLKTISEGISIRI